MGRNPFEIRAAFLPALVKKANHETLVAIPLRSGQRSYSSPPAK